MLLSDLITVRWLITLMVRPYAVTDRVGLDNSPVRVLNSLIVVVHKIGRNGRFSLMTLPTMDVTDL